MAFSGFRSVFALPFSHKLDKFVPCLFLCLFFRLSATVFTLISSLSFSLCPEVAALALFFEFLDDRVFTNRSIKDQAPSALLDHSL